MKNKKAPNISVKCFCRSGLQDSNLRPPAPKAGALTGLRQTPKEHGGGCEKVRDNSTYDC